jgi:gliding motility-associated-like protein
MKKIIAGVLGLMSVYTTYAQTYTPIAVTGYNHDVVAETYPNSLTSTDTVLDATNHIMYSQAFATAGSFAGGLPNSGLITDAANVHQYQLASYASNNILNVMRGASRTMSLATPAAYQKLSVLAYSTENASTINITVNFTDGTSTSYITNYTLPDWFFGTVNVVGSGYGRTTRVASVTSIEGPPSNPVFYYIDFNLNCADKKKLVQSLTYSNITTTGTNAPYPNAVFLAVSGQTNTQTINVTAVPVSCGNNNGSASVSVTGNTGPYTISWSTTPVQTTATINNLAAGTYTATITDAAGCTSTQTVTVTQLTSPTSITASATPSSICSGSSTQLSVQATGAGLSTYTWTPGNNTTATVTVTPTVTTTYTVLGNDAAGCPYSRQVTVVVNQKPNAPTILGAQVCGGTGNLQVQTPQAAYSYAWYNTATGGTPVATGSGYPVNLTSPQTYYVEAINGGCASTRTAITATPLPAAQANAGGNKIIIAGDAIQLNATGSQGTYLWTPATGLSATNILNPTANPITTTTYTLNVTNAQGCTASDRATITVIANCIQPMEAFSPNGDGTNDLWLISSGNCLQYARVVVFNRYGSTVYESNDYKNNWDGTYKNKPVPDGTYYFIITYKLVSDRVVTLRGNVTILR